MQVVEKHSSSLRFGRTLYHLLGIGPDKELYTTNGHPVKILADEAALIRKIIA